MNAETAHALQRINLQFYQTFAQPFSATRQRVQPGVRQVLATIPSHANLLDLGCGNGELARTLFSQGHQGIYLGLDFSADLITAGLKLQVGQSRYAFLHADLLDPGWDAAVSALALEMTSHAMKFDFVLAFAVLHHIPGDHFRRQVLDSARSLMQPSGEFIHSEWQFLSSHRLRGRIIPWQTIGLDDHTVDPGDFLLDWRHGGYGIRYVHHFTEAELLALAAETGFIIDQAFYSDGEGGRLSLYQRWRPI